MRTIDADKLREEWLENGENEYVYDTNAVLESIDNQPTIEAKPVVHCKNCAFFDEYSKHPKRYLYTVEGADGVCFLHRLNSDNSQFHARRFEDFCSDGERDT